MIGNLLPKCRLGRREPVVFYKAYFVQLNRRLPHVLIGIVLGVSTLLLKIILVDAVNLECIKVFISSF